MERCVMMMPICLEILYLTWERLQSGWQPARLVKDTKAGRCLKGAPAGYDLSVAIIDVLGTT